MRDRLIFLASLLALLAVWETGATWFGVPKFVLPAPSDIAGKIGDDIVSGSIWPHLEATFLEVIFGFAAAAIGGVVLGSIIGLFRPAERILYPYILVLQTIPKAAIAPLLIVWIGFGIQSKIVCAGLIAFFPIVANVIAGLKTVDHRRILLLRSMRANSWQIFIKVRFPSLLPYLFAGLEVGVVFALLGAIIGEFLGAATGLGSLLIQRQAATDLAGVFAVLFYLALMASSLNFALKAVAGRYAFWTRVSTPASS